MGPGKASVPLIIERILDIDVSVQLTAFEKISKMPMTYLSIEQRQFILRVGFSLRTKDIIKNFVKNLLLPRWLSYVNGNHFEFLKALTLDATEKDLKQSTDIMENVLKSCFR